MCLSVIVKGMFNAAASKDILYNCMPLTLRQKFEEEPHMAVMFRGICIYIKVT